MSGLCGFPKRAVVSKADLIHLGLRGFIQDELAPSALVSIETALAESQETADKFIAACEPGLIGYLSRAPSMSPLVPPPSSMGAELQRKHRFTLVCGLSAIARCAVASCLAGLLQMKDRSYLRGAMSLRNSLVHMQRLHSYLQTSNCAVPVPPQEPRPAKSSVERRLEGNMRAIVEFSILGYSLLRFCPALVPRGYHWMLRVIGLAPDRHAAMEMLALLERELSAGSPSRKDHVSRAARRFGLRDGSSGPSPSGSTSTDGHGASTEGVAEFLEQVLQSRKTSSGHGISYCTSDTELVGEDTGQSVAPSRPTAHEKLESFPTAAGGGGGLPASDSHPDRSRPGAAGSRMELDRSIAALEPPGDAISTAADSVESLASDWLWAAEGVSLGSAAGVLVHGWIQCFFSDDLRRSCDVLAEGLRVFPNGGMYSYLAGYAARRAGDTPLSLSLFLHSARSTSSSLPGLAVMALGEAANVLFLQCRWEASARVAKEFLRLHKASSYRAASLHELGVCLFACGYEDDALGAMGRVEAEARPGFTFDAFASRKANEFIDRQGTSFHAASAGTDATRGSTAEGFSFSRMLGFSLTNESGAVEASKKVAQASSGPGGRVASSTPGVVLPFSRGGVEQRAGGMSALEFCAICAQNLGRGGESCASLQMLQTATVFMQEALRNVRPGGAACKALGECMAAMRVSGVGDDGMASSVKFGRCWPVDLPMPSSVVEVESKASFVKDVESIRDAGMGSHESGSAASGGGRGGSSEADSVKGKGELIDQIEFAWGLLPAGRFGRMLVPEVSSDSAPVRGSPSLCPLDDLCFDVTHLGLLLMVQGRILCNVGHAMVGGEALRDRRYSYRQVTESLHGVLESAGQGLSRSLEGSPGVEHALNGAWVHSEMYPDDPASLPTIRRWMDEVADPWECVRAGRACLDVVVSQLAAKLKGDFVIPHCHALLCRSYLWEAGRGDDGSGDSRKREYSTDGTGAASGRPAMAGGKFSDPQVCDIPLKRRLIKSCVVEARRQHRLATAFSGYDFDKPLGRQLIGLSDRLGAMEAAVAEYHAT